MEKWKREKSELILDTPFFKVRKDIVVLPDGREYSWIYWDSNDSVMVLGMTEEKKLVMIKQYRYLVDDVVIEFPSGGLHKDERPEIGAKREFEEETGFACSELMPLGSFYETYGSLNRKIHIFFAPNVMKSKQNLDAGEEGYENIDVELIDFQTAVDLAMQNKIVAMGSSLAVLLLREKVARAEVVI